MSDDGEPVPSAKGKRARHLVIVGGLLCFAAMWLPLRRGDDAFVPMQDELGAACWAWLLVPALALGSMRRRAALALLVRVFCVIAGLVGSIVALLLSIAFHPVLVVVLLPPPVLVGAIGLWPARSADRGASRLLIAIGLGGLAMACLFADGAGIGVPILGVGSLVLLAGATSWAVTARGRDDDGDLPRAVAR